MHILHYPTTGHAWPGSSAIAAHHISQMPAGLKYGGQDRTSISLHNTIPAHGRQPFVGEWYKFSSWKANLFYTYANIGRMKSRAGLFDLLSFRGQNPLAIKQAE